MDGYRVALFFHLLALVAASAASGLVHVAESRSHRAATLREARMWLMLTAKTARTFPIAVVVLFGTGAYMISAGPGWTWSTGWVVAGIGGAILLLAQGAILGGRGRRIKLAIQQLAADGGLDRTAPLPHDPVIGALSWANTALAMAIVFVMTTKPSLEGAILELAIGYVTGVVIGLSGKRSRTTERESAGLAAESIPSPE